MPPTPPLHNPAQPTPLLRKRRYPIALLSPASMRDASPPSLSPSTLALPPPRPLPQSCIPPYPLPLRPEDDHLRSLPQHRLSSRPGAYTPPAAMRPHALSRLTARRNPQYQHASPPHHAADPIPAPVQECRGLLSSRALKSASTTRDAPSTSAPARHPPPACGEHNLLSSGGITVALQPPPKAVGWNSPWLASPARGSSSRLAPLACARFARG
jgi:hypothetical protein